MTRSQDWLAERERWLRGRLAGINPYVVDSLIALVSIAVSLWAVHNDETHWPLWTYLLAAGCSLPLPWRRRAPLGGFLVSMVLSGALGIYAHSAQPQIPVYGVVIIYTLADLGRNWQRWPMLAVLIAANVLGTRSLNGFIFSELTVIGSFALGAAVRELRRLAQVEADRARETGLRAASDAARAVAEERGRIAREMHDILAHAVALMVIQAEAGPLVVRADPEKAIKAFDTIADSGRDAMVQLRRVLGVLKEDGAGPVLAPQPKLPELAAVAERMTAAGVAVRLVLPERSRALPADVETAAYRIVQEALTNIVKHSGADAAEVRIAEVGQALELAVSDNGQGLDARARELRRAAGGAGWSGGRGLLGIRERAAACGGQAMAGPAPDGRGFVVTARLPIGAA
ncbi:sensor histidine kinase [Kitasatospora kifunensis]|uniref:histidine kinase n=1 Tax=Kitasatospora kifunensis TaxID=58351 RepID=A0A7W7VW90_KITKI|nr:histidine kinase [Kitasatospora kifunensis]MBB4925186.1 signal transduction histidine kinase [Kitasatospora kifunensis]